jgi:hypothetical protein
VPNLAKQRVAAAASGRAFVTSLPRFYLKNKSLNIILLNPNKQPETAIVEALTRARQSRLVGILHERLPVNVQRDHDCRRCGHMKARRRLWSSGGCESIADGAE